MFRDRFYTTRPPRPYRAGYLRSRPQNRRILFVIAFIAILMFILFTSLGVTIYSAFGSKDHNLEHIAAYGSSVETPAVEEWNNEAPRDVFNQKIISAAERVNATVVSVIRYRKDEKGEQKQAGIGSGVIFENERGKVRVVTNFHVIDGGDAFEVVLHNEIAKKAKVIGKDMLSDLAVLEMDDKDVEHYAVFGDSDGLKVGDAVLAVGNPLGLGFSHTTTFGVVSSINRSIPISLSNNGFYDWEMQVIQTDAAINRGNSGGALVNLDGEVIGINNMKVANFGVEGLGFAIPSNTVVPIIESLVKHGKVKRPFMGVATLDYDYVPEEKELNLPRGVKEGLLVMTVSGPAEAAGLKEDDFIVALDEKEVSSTIELRQYLYEHKGIGEDLEVTFYRDRKQHRVVLSLGENE